VYNILKNEYLRVLTTLGKDIMLPGTTSIQYFVIFTISEMATAETCNMRMTMLD